jgi:hypothetical protein
VNLALEEVISHVKRFRTQLLDIEIFSVIQRAEIEVQNALGGLSNSKFAHLFQAEITQTLTSDSSSLVLPGEAGKVISAEVDGRSVTVLPISQKAAVGSNHLYSDAAVRNGSEITFYGLPVSTPKKRAITTARVVYETSFETPVFVDGFYGKFSTMPYSVGGADGKSKSLKVIEVMRPDGKQFQDNQLKGATLRLYDSNKNARDWSVFTNFWKHPMDAVEKGTETQRIVLNDDMNNVSVNFPNWVEIPITDKEGKALPFRLTRISLPPSLREAIILWAKYDLTGDPRLRQDFYAFIDRVSIG